MASELALHAYVFLGNALNLLVNRAGAPQRAEVHASAESLRELYGKVESMTPNTILGSVDALSPEERLMLLRVCAWCVQRLGDDAAPLVGVTESEASEVIAWLEERVGGG